MANDPKLLFPEWSVFGTNPPDCSAIWPLVTGICPSNWVIVMRVLLLRVGALAVVVVLGWITLANAQRDSNDTSAGRVDNPSNNGGVPTGESAGSANPLRTSPAPARSYPPAAEPAAPRPAADPFGLQARRGGSSAAPSAGPALSPSDADRPVNDSRATGADRATDRTAGQHVALPAPDSQEPAPFKADPFAMPASPTRAVKDDRGPVGAAVQLPPSIARQQSRCGACRGG